MLTTSDSDPGILEWLKDEHGYIPALDTFTIANRSDQNDAILGCLVFFHHPKFNDDDNSISLVAASDGSGKWFNKSMRAALFGYPFLVLQKDRILGVIDEDLDHDLRFWEKQGARPAPESDPKPREGNVLYEFPKEDADLDNPLIYQVLEDLDLT